MSAATVSAPSAREAAQRDEVTRLGLWMFLATVTMLFAAFTSAYLVRKGGSDWSKIPLPPVLWRNTLFLVVSSAALEAVRTAGGRRRLKLANTAMAVTIGLALAFLAGQWQGWQQLQAAGIYLPANPSSSFFYMMTGAHAVHVLAGLAVLLWAALVTWRGDAAANPRSWARAIDLCRTFWHFLLGVWVYLFALISLV